MSWIKRLSNSISRFVTGNSPAGCYRVQNSAAFLGAYRRWIEEQAYLPWTAGIFKAYHFKKCQVSSRFRLQLIEEPNRRGLLLYYHPEIGQASFRYLFEFLKDRSLDHGYQLYLSDERVIVHERYTETITKHYLKPPAVDAPDCRACNQRYGNIIIDLISVNGQPGYIRFYVNSFAGPHFTEPLPFEELLESILSPEPPVPIA